MTRMPDRDDFHVDGVVAKSDARATNSASSRNFYKSRVPIYPKTVRGPKNSRPTVVCRTLAPACCCPGCGAATVG